MRTWRPGLGLVAAFAAGAAAAEPTPVRVYTNADLEPLPPAAQAERVVPAASPEDWSFVTEFLAREHERLAAERAHELERRRAQVEDERWESEASSVYWPWYVGSWTWDEAHPHRRLAPQNGLHDRIVPLHARPSPGREARAKAIHAARPAGHPRHGHGRR
jgi:hypothetical protein